MKKEKTRKHFQNYKMTNEFTISKIKKYVLYELKNMGYKPQILC